MGIPESQLKTWANQGAVAMSAATYEAVQQALGKYAWGSDVRYEVYLQGSYKNSTNIRGDSDVDVVVQLNSTFYYDESDLPEPDLSIWRGSVSKSTYEWSAFRDDVLKSLRDYFGSSSVKVGSKSIKVIGNANRLPSDVVVCFQYRKYRRFRSWSDQDYAEGMKFYVPDEDRWVINFPKIHYDNGIAKNGRVDEWFKPAVRIFKNARGFLVGQRIITDDLAPSYFVECLLYNASNSSYGISCQNTFCSVVNELERASFEKFVCQNEQAWLFGGTPEQWSELNARRYIQALVQLWNNWKD